MSMRKFTIEHDTMISGTFPKADIEAIKGITVEVTKISIFREKVTISVDNRKEEDFYAICYEIGCLAQSVIDNRMYG